jgi:cell division septum initiation protein DivIVA
MNGGPGGVPVDETVLGIVDFPTVRRGYAPDSVRTFVSAAHAELRRLTDDNARLHLRIDRLQREAEVAARALDEARRSAELVAPMPSMPPPVLPVLPALPPPQAPDHRPAHAPVTDWNQVADDLVRGARAESEAIVAAARRDATSFVERADAEAAAILDRANVEAMAVRREAADAAAAAGSTARVELEQVERQRAAIAASLTALQQALVHAVAQMGARPSRTMSMTPPTLTAVPSEQTHQG